MTQNTRELDRALDLFDHRIERGEHVWFCRPGRVDGTPARIVGRTAFAKDAAQRDGLSGAAVVIGDERVAAAGYGVPLAAVEDLHDRFLQLCSDPASLQIGFGREQELLAGLPVTGQGSSLSIASTALTRLKLPPDWHEHATLPDIFLLIARHTPLRDAQRRGFVLREKESAKYDDELDSRLLTRWLDIVLEQSQERGGKIAADRGRIHSLMRERDEARERSGELSVQLEKEQEALRAAQDNLHALELELHAFKEWRQNQDGHFTKWAEAIQERFDEVSGRIDAKLGQLDGLLQPLEAGIQAQSTRTPFNDASLPHLSAGGHQATWPYAVLPGERLRPAAGPGFTDLARLFDRLKKEVIRGVGILKNAVFWGMISVVVLVILWLVWRLQPVMTLQLGRLWPGQETPAGKDAGAAAGARETPKGSTAASDKDQVVAAAAALGKCDIRISAPNAFLERLRTNCGPDPGNGDLCQRDLPALRVMLLQLRQCTNAQCPAADWRGGEPPPRWSRESVMEAVNFASRAVQCLKIPDKPID